MANGKAPLAEARGAPAHRVSSTSSRSRPDNEVADLEPTAPVHVTSPSVRVRSLGDSFRSIRCRTARKSACRGAIVAASHTKCTCPRKWRVRSSLSNSGSLATHPKRTTRETSSEPRPAATDLGFSVPIPTGEVLRAPRVEASLRSDADVSEAMSTSRRCRTWLQQPTAVHTDTYGRITTSRDASRHLPASQLPGRVTCPSSGPTRSIDPSRRTQILSRAVAESANAVQGGCMAKTHSDLETLFPFTGKPGVLLAEYVRAGAQGIDITGAGRRAGLSYATANRATAVLVDAGSSSPPTGVPTSSTSTHRTAASPSTPSGPPPATSTATSREPGPIRPGGTAVPEPRGPRHRTHAPHARAATATRADRRRRRYRRTRPVSAGARSFVLGIERVVGSSLLLIVDTLQEPYALWHVERDRDLIHKTLHLGAGVHARTSALTSATTNARPRQPSRPFDGCTLPTPWQPRRTTSKSSSQSSRTSSTSQARQQGRRQVDRAPPPRPGDTGTRS